MYQVKCLFVDASVPVKLGFIMRQAATRCSEPRHAQCATLGAFSGHCETVSEDWLTAVPVMAAVSVSALSPVSVVVQWAGPLTTSCLHWEVVVREVGER